MIKQAINNYPINDLTKNRWSPRSFSNKKVEKEKLLSLFEAARWSASAYNEQPWRFLIGFQGDDNYSKILGTLVEFNQEWASKAPVLILNCFQINFTHNQQPNHAAKYDLGQAVAVYSLEAVNQGLFTHQMTGFDADKANLVFNFDKQISAFSVSAIGYLGNAEELPPHLLKMEKSERIRMLQSDFMLNPF